MPSTTGCPYGATVSMTLPGALINPVPAGVDATSTTNQTTNHQPASAPLLPRHPMTMTIRSTGRWSTWDVAQQGPTPHPDWLVIELVAVDTELGVLKTGKEADVHLVERAVPGTSRSCLLAAKRYRTAEHRMFHRDAAYIEGRRVRRSREARAMARRTAFGRDLLAGQWAAAEFSALCRLWRLGAPVPYPAQLLGTELLLEYLAEEDGQAAPRLAQLRPDPAALRTLWDQLIDAWCYSPTRAWRTATCPRSTCWCTADDWCSSTCHRWWTSSPTRRARRSSCGTSGS